ncbi:unnamed protein product [Urochloa humidicola]
MDDPQVITRKNRMLALTGPYRALAAFCNMYFEFDLKMKGEGAVDEDFSKGFKVLNVFKHPSGVPCTFSLESFRAPQRIKDPCRQSIEHLGMQPLATMRTVKATPPNEVATKVKETNRCGDAAEAARRVLASDSQGRPAPETPSGGTVHP